MDWIGGVKYSSVRWSYQLLCMRHGPQTAASMMTDPDIILWPDRRRPPLHLLHRWYDEMMGVEIYETKESPDLLEIPPKFEASFYKRLDNQVKYDGARVIRANANAAVVLADKAARGELDEKDAKILVALNNGVGWVQDKMFNAEKKAAPQTNVFLPFPEPPRPKKLRGGTPLAIEASYEVVDGRAR